MIRGLSRRFLLTALEPPARQGWRYPARCGTPRSWSRSDRRSLPIASRTHVGARHEQRRRIRALKSFVIQSEKSRPREGLLDEDIFIESQREGPAARRRAPCHPGARITEPAP